mgnify:CR=1 FL=1
MFVGVYSGEKNLTLNKPFILKDDISLSPGGLNGRKIKQVTKSAFDKLEELVMNLEIKEKPAESVLVA